MHPQEDPIEISPQALVERVRAGEPILLVDVREPWEYDVCRIEGANLVPLGEIPSRVEELRIAGAVVCYCHRGVRSLEAASWLRSKGVVKATSLSGGIERWSLEIDRSVPRY